MEERTELQRKLSETGSGMRVCFFEPLAKHTSLRIGGNAEAIAFPQNEEELTAIVKKSRLWNLKPAILGAGTNILAPDEGLPGLVICLKELSGEPKRLDETHIRVPAGMPMARAASFAAKHGLSGLEFAHGIPGTVGGGVYMNAGAYGGEMGAVVTGARVMRPDGTVQSLTRDELHFSYRHSALQEQPGIVLSADFALTPGDPEQIAARMRELMRRRVSAQPLELPSAGSAFKRPRGGYAAALIEQAELKGFRVGGAGISEKHAGFAVNLGNATAGDVKKLLREVSDRVYARTGIRLEPEIRIW